MDLFVRYKSISIFRAAADRLYPLAALLSCNDETDAAEKCAAVFKLVAESGADTTGEWIASLLYADDNVFSRKVARGERIPDRIKSAVCAELVTFKQLSLVKPDGFVTSDNKEYFPRFGYGGMSVTYERLLAHYIQNGCGAVACGNAFRYRDGAFIDCDCGSIRLADIKSYAEEKAEIVRNTENFIAGRPAFHALIYGDRGTGKSATVRAVANEYRDKLKLIELSGPDIAKLPELTAELCGSLQKYIFFIDDVDRSGVKTLERALDAPIGNALLYCTACVPTKSGEGDANGVEALFNRFGLVITYLTPDKEGFCDILKQILRSRGIKWHDEYASVAELAALKKGDRSPRAARQIADLIESNYVERRCY